MPTVTESGLSKEQIVVHVFSEDDHPRGYVLTSEKLPSESYGSEDLQTILRILLSLVFKKELTGRITIATFPPEGYKGQLNRNPSPLAPEDIAIITNIFNCKIKTKR